VTTGLFILGVLAILWWVASTQTDGKLDESDPLITPPEDDEDKE